jgi:hypothetical protein
MVDLYIFPDARREIVISSTVQPCLRKVSITECKGSTWLFNIALVVI